MTDFKNSDTTPRTTFLCGCGERISLKEPGTTEQVLKKLGEMKRKHCCPKNEKWSLPFHRRFINVFGGTK